jgi:hypothetical protein
MTVFTPSVIKTIQKNTSLQFTDEGAPGDELIFDVLPLLFPGQLMGSFWYKILGDPPTGDTRISVIEAGGNEINIGIAYGGANVGSFYAELNEFRFVSEPLFDTDVYTDWMHVPFFINWQDPLNSAVWWNNVLKLWDTLPAITSTQFNPTTSSIDLNPIVAGVEWASIWMAPAISVTTVEEFDSKIRPRLSNGFSPYSLGKRAGAATSQYSYTYLTFENKEGSGGMINDANGSTLNFGTFTDYQRNLQANITLP